MTFIPVINQRFQIPRVKNNDQMYISVPQFYFERSRILKEPNIFWMIQFLAIWRSLAGIMPTDDVHYKEKMTTCMIWNIHSGRKRFVYFSFKTLHNFSCIYYNRNGSFFFLDKITHLLNLVLCQVIIKREKKRN